MELTYAESGPIAWFKAHDEGGAPLTEAVTLARKEWEDAEKAIRAVPKPPEAMSPSKLMLREGLTLEEAEAESEARYAAIADWKRRTQVLREVWSGKAGRVNRAVAEDLDDLVIGVRDTVTGLIDEVRPHAEKLARFAPDFDPQRILSSITTSELKGYTTAVGLQNRFDLIHKAWAMSYMTEARIHRAGESPAYGSGRFAWSAYNMGREHFYWAEPTLVREPRLNGQAVSRTGRRLPPSTSLLLIALESPECGYRLATFGDLAERARLEWDARHAAARQATQLDIRS